MKLQMASSPRRRGPITPSADYRARRCNVVHHTKRHGVWVPAFAGTTRGEVAVLSPSAPRRLARRRQFYARLPWRHVALQLVELRQEFAEHGEVILFRF